MTDWIIRQYRGFRIWFALRFNRPLNVCWFGADPIGEKDSTEAFQRAVNAGGNVVKVPFGKFRSQR